MSNSFAALKQFALAAILSFVMVGCAQQANQDEPMKTVPPPKEAPAAPPPVDVPLDPQLRAAARAELLDASDSDDPHLRCNAIEALEDAQPDVAVAVAQRALSDRDATVRFAACMAVGGLREQDAHDRLLRMRESEDSPVVQVAVRYALHCLGDYRWSHDLETYAMSSDPQVRGKTAFVLGMLGEPTAVAVLQPMRRDPVETVRLQASASLWRLGDQTGLEDLCTVAANGYPD